MTGTDMTGTGALRIREATRAVVLAPDRHVLLVRFEFPQASRWALPGGGIEPGETPIDALRRELAEEVGLHDAPIGPHLWSRLHIVPFLNGLYDGQREQIHLVAVDHAFEPRPALDWEQLNAEYVFELRWWRIDDIVAADHLTFAPAELGRLLDHLHQHGPPTEPTDISV
jgi:8-oxo-dGTP pyrophosphatase MutT (NUDIX family)